MEKRKAVISLVMSLLLIVSLMPATYAMAGDSIGINAVTVPPTAPYTPFRLDNGVIQNDRVDYMAASNNPIAQDIANAVFQGPGFIRGAESLSVGYMKDIYINVTNLGTLTYFNYTGEGYFMPTGHPWAGNWSGDRPIGGDGNYHWLNIFDPDSEATWEARFMSWNGSPVTWEPLEGWAIAYTLSPRLLSGSISSPPPDDSGYLVVTYSGFVDIGGDEDLVPNVIGQDADDDWLLSVAANEMWVNNPRLAVYHVKVVAENIASPYDPVFHIHTVIVFNKATKFVEVWTKAYLARINDLGKPWTFDFEFQLSRMAIFDANPACDWALYGWKFLNISYEGTIDPQAFITLSFINTTCAMELERRGSWAPGWDYYAAYMLAYPVNETDLDDGTSFSYAIVSVIPSYLTAINDTEIPLSPGYEVWHSPFITGTKYQNSSYLDMANRTEKPCGDQALVRYEWYKSGTVPYRDLMDNPRAYMYADWKLVMYGVYDVEDYYWGGVGGPLWNGTVWLPDGAMVFYNDTAESWQWTDGTTTVNVSNTWVDDPLLVTYHTGTLLYLNTGDPTDLREELLFKHLIFLDLNRDGIIDNRTYPTGERWIPYNWTPTEELVWQLYWKFAPTTFDKLPYVNIEFDYLKPGITGNITWDFMVAGSPGRVTDALGAAWLNARFTAHLVLFDVNASSGSGRLPPFTERLNPYLMLVLTPEGSGEDYATRKAHYLTADGRAFPQMYWMDDPETPWRDLHFLTVSVAGPLANLFTYYFNDFATIVFPYSGDATGSLVVLPYKGPYSYSSYLDTASRDGLAVIATSRDHFNNVALLVWGLTAQDTYWAAWYAYQAAQ